jgi:hypothetical protein|tara:strand:- start:2107 stop:2571 length:465 start_codon:yes stop_codon:yes gene_type:complete
MANSALTTGEIALFDYIFAGINAAHADDDTVGTQAFRDELPAVFNSDNARMWTAYFEGGGEPDDVNQTANQSCKINGRFVFDGVFTSKATAQQYACTIKTLFNTDSVTNVAYTEMTQDPLIVRAVVNRDPDQATSGEVRVWRLTVEFNTGMSYK